MMETTPEHAVEVSYFRHILPASRLGQQHETLGIYRKSVRSVSSAAASNKKTRKEYTLIVVTETSRRRILLGHKQRGFGQGMFNSFGGKVEPGETIAESSRRELEEETGISLPLDCMKAARVGQLSFTFDDNPSHEMLVHLFRVHITTTKPSCENSSQATSAYYVDPACIRPCDEIIPQWFNWPDIPLYNMFADDSVWLTHLLLHQEVHDPAIQMNGWFYFSAGGAEVNTILHFYLDIVQPSGGGGQRNEQRHCEVGHTRIPLQKDKSTQLAASGDSPVNLEKLLFHEIHQRTINSPTIKEFNESYAFVKALRLKNAAYDLVLDVAGGHGALGALFLTACPSIHTAVVIDPARVGNQGVKRAWGHYFADKTLRYRHECLRTGMPAELDFALEECHIPRERILVVSCHACQHLSDEIMEISCRYGVNVAVMPCCQKDQSGGTWKSASQNLGIPIEKTMDLLLAGKAMSWSVGNAAAVSYDVRMKVVSKSVSPQNRIIFCRVIPPSTVARSTKSDTKTASAHRKLEQAYNRAHRDSKCEDRLQTPGTKGNTMFLLGSRHGIPLIAAFGLGVLTASLWKQASR